MITCQKINKWISDLRPKIQSDSIGFVPTMGGLHSGHEKLILESIRENEVTVTSIFLNPTQFNNPEDLDTYPSRLSDDLKLLEKIGVNYVLIPSYKDIYPDNYNFKVLESSSSKKLCGAHRPGHFEGVLTVVLKLFNIVKPHSAYFGEKDFQQLRLIENMVDAFFLPIKIRRVPTVREPSGLALSSRNRKLNSERLSKASELYSLIKSNFSDSEITSKLKSSGWDVDYVQTIKNRRYAAAFLDNVRLIDNVKI